MGNACCSADAYTEVINNILRHQKIHRKYSRENLVTAISDENDDEEESEIQPHTYAAPTQQGVVSKRYSSTATARRDCPVLLGPPTREEFLKFPFLVNEELGRLVVHTRFLFIMRGPAGSGKSYIVERMKLRFPSLKHCSADKFWYAQSEDGETYAYDPDRVDEAHEYCRNEVLRAVEAVESPVVVDNTNIRRWQFKYYIELARQHDYQVVLVSPQTPWRFDPTSLADRNAHRVSVDTAQTMVRTFELATPLYYAWHLPPPLSRHGRQQLQQSHQSPSQRLASWAGQSLQRITALPSVAQYFCEEFQLPRGCTVRDILQSWTNASNMPVKGLRVQKGKKKGPLHVTTFFNGGSSAKSDFGQVYTGLSHVNDSLLGELQDLSVYGLFLTKRTVGVRVGLPLSTERLRVLWGVFDRELVPGADDQEAVARRVTGCRAHFTLGLQAGVAPVETGHDLLRLVDHESSAASAASSSLVHQWPEARLLRVDIPNVTQEQLKLIDPDYRVYYLELTRPFTLRALFGGYY